jgi:hypothetical protein
MKHLTEMTFLVRKLLLSGVVISGMLVVVFWSTAYQAISDALIPAPLQPDTASFVEAATEGCWDVLEIWEDKDLGTVFTIWEKCTFSAGLMPEVNQTVQDLIDNQFISGEIVTFEWVKKNRDGSYRVYRYNSCLAEEMFDDISRATCYDTQVFVRISADDRRVLRWWIEG